jgi:hypothetical protein
VPERHGGAPRHARRGGEGWRDHHKYASIPAASLQADHDHDQDITRCVDYVYCRSDRAVEGGGGGIRGSADIVTVGREVVPHRGGVGRTEEEARGGEPLRGRSHGDYSSSGSSSKPIGDECRRCGKVGHCARECCSKPRKEQAHVAQDEEEASLMLTTATLIHLEAGQIEVTV